MLKRVLPKLIVFAAVIAAGGWYLYDKSGDTASNTTTQTKENTVAFTPAAARGSGRYPDGTYTAVGIYAPHGLDTELEVKVTLKDGIITDVDSNLLSPDSFSRQMTEKFKSGYKTLVIGKPIEGLKLGTVSGSSLTPVGFNDALRKIESYAEAL